MMRKFTPLFAELQIMELFEFRSCLNLNGFLQSVDSCTTMSWLQGNVTGVCALSLRGVFFGQTHRPTPPRHTKKACPCKKSRPRNIKVLNYFLFSNENLLAIDNVDTGNGNRVNLATGEVINSTLAEVVAGNTLDILNTGCTAPVEAIELNSLVGY